MFTGGNLNCGGAAGSDGSIPDEVIDIFQSRNSSGSTKALGSTRPRKKNKYQKYLVGWGGGLGGRCIRLSTWPPSWADCLKFLGVSTSWSLTDYLHTYRDSSTFTLLPLLCKAEALLTSSRRLTAFLKTGVLGILSQAYQWIQFNNVPPIYFLCLNKNVKITKT